MYLSIPYLRAAWSVFAWIIELCRKIYVGALDAIVKVQPK